MKKYEKEIQQTFLNNEEAIIKRLKQVYNKSLDDITKKAQTLHEEFEDLKAVYDNIEDEEEREILKSRMQSKVYQKKYQESLKKQVSDILDKMHKEEFTNVADYLNKCYEDGFATSMYSLQKQNIPLCFPLDQEAMVRAVQLDSKISQGLYSRLGEDVGMLKKKITAQVSRGIATGMTFKQVAQQLSAYTKIGYNNAIRIARTEGHRIQCQSAMDTCYKAKEKGADVVKQWDATLDGRTRESHAMVDGEIRELDEKFSNGLMLPGDSSGGAAEVVNCRCALLQRAKWAVQGGFTKMNNFTKQLESFEKPEDYAEFKKAFFSKENKKYMNYVQDMEEKYGTKDFQKVLDMMNTREYNHYSKLVKSNPVFNKQPKQTKVLTNNVKSVKMQVEKFKPAATLKEAAQRMSDVLNVEKVSLGRMPVELANQYLEGTEKFIKDFPMLKKYYNAVGTKTGASGIMGVNKLSGKYIDNRTKLELSCELHLKSTSNLEKLLADYAEDAKKGGSYANESPLSTAIHELVHGIDHAITFKQHGGFDENGLGIINASDWGSASAGVSHKIIKQAREELFGAQYGKEVAEKTRYLGSYARTSSKEELAEAISYEYVSESNPYSARILELFKEEVEGVFGK